MLMKLSFKNVLFETYKIDKQAMVGYQIDNYNAGEATFLICAGVLGKALKVEISANSWYFENIPNKRKIISFPAQNEKENY